MFEQFFGKAYISPEHAVLIKITVSKNNNNCLKLQCVKCWCDYAMDQIIQMAYVFVNKIEQIK